MSLLTSLRVAVSDSIMCIIFKVLLCSLGSRAVAERITVFGIVILTMLWGRCTG